MIFKQLRELFVFTRKERNGILLLLFILLCSISMNVVLPFFIRDKEYDVAAWSREVEKYQTSVAPREEITITAFEGVIDPNLAQMTDLLNMGIPENIAANWVKYLQKGGRFRRVEEVMKLYGMNPILYKKIEGHLKIFASTDFPKQKQFKLNHPGSLIETNVGHDSVLQGRVVGKREVRMVAINKADSAELESLPGIGPVLASRIIKYRRLLGGYYAVSQLKEIYGMTDELWAKSAPYFTVDTLGIIKMNLDFLSISEMGKHPYIGYKQAKRVVRKRDSIGKIRTVEELRDLFSPDSIRNLLPYLLIGGSKP